MIIWLVLAVLLSLIAVYIWPIGVSNETSQKLKEAPPSEPISDIVQLTLELLKSPSEWNVLTYTYVGFPEGLWTHPSGVQVDCVDSLGLTCDLFLSLKVVTDNENLVIPLNRTESKALVDAIKSAATSLQDFEKDKAARIVATRITTGTTAPLLGGPGVSLGHDSSIGVKGLGTSNSDLLRVLTRDAEGRLRRFGSEDSEKLVISPELKRQYGIK